MLDNGEVNRIKAPHTIFTQIGTQRVFVVHEDSIFADVYKTDAQTFEEAEADVYTMDYKEVINDCQLSPSHRLKKSNFSFNNDTFNFFIGIKLKFFKGKICFSN